MNSITTFFKNLFARIKGTHSVDAAVSSVTKAIAKLKEVRDSHFVQATVHSVIAEEATKAKAFYQAESERAHKIVQNLENLLGIKK